MQKKVCLTTDEAVAGIPDGSTIMIAGFGPGTPNNLLAALHRQGAKDLTGICNFPGAPPDMGFGNLVLDKRFIKMHCAFTDIGRSGMVVPFFDAYQAHEIEAELMSQGTLAERIRAAGIGVPAFYTPATVGTELAEGKEHRDFDGRTYVLEQALPADYAFIRAWKADSFGNLIFRRSQRNFNPIMATAAQCTIVEVEEPIVEPGELDPDTIHTSGIYVSRIVKIPAESEGGLWEKAFNIA